MLDARPAWYAQTTPIATAARHRSKRAVVCGAGGFIGSHLVAQLLAEGWWVRAIDQRFPWGRPEAEEVLELDLRRADACARAVAGGIGDVYQLAATSTTGFNAVTMRDDALIQLNMLQAAGTAGVGRFFYASSDGVYPDLGQATTLDETWADAERAPDQGWTSLFAERALATYAAQCGFEPRVARFGDCYGPHDRTARFGAIAGLCRRIAVAPTDDYVTITAGANDVSAPVYVTDLVEAIRVLVESGEDRPVNVAGHQPATYGELALIVAEIAGREIQIAAEPGPARGRHLSLQRLDQLGWAPRVDLRSGLEATYLWCYRQLVEDLAEHGTRRAGAR